MSWTAVERALSVSARKCRARSRARTSGRRHGRMETLEALKQDDEPDQDAQLRREGGGSKVSTGSTLVCSGRGSWPAVPDAGSGLSSSRGSA